MKEVRLLAFALVALLIASYASWTSADFPVEVPDPVVWDIAASSLESAVLVTRTHTVSISRFGPKGYPWIEVKKQRGRVQRAFVGNDRALRVIDRLAPFVATRSLGAELSPQEIEPMGLESSPRRLTVRAIGQTRVFNLGKQTFGARYHYLRAQGEQEIFLLAPEIITDLQTAERSLRQVDVMVKPLADIRRARLVADDHSLTIEQKKSGPPAIRFGSGAAKRPRTQP